ncbi:MAG: hypothetical protein ACRC80_33725 [Waterburya sp.]
MLTNDFKQLITEVDKIGDGDDFILDQLLKQSGKLIYQGSLVILERAQQCLDEQLQFQIEVKEEDTIVDELFSIYLDNLCQQSINTNFLDSYLQPRKRKPYERNSTTTIIQNLTPVEAIAEFDGEGRSGFPTMPNRHVDLIEEVVNLAHDEDINLWVEEVGRFLQGSLEINTLKQIVEQTDLSLVQVFMALLFGDFELERGSKKFYSISFKVSLKS